MDQQQWEKIDNILDEALTLTSPEKRKAFVSKKCNSDEQLYQEIISLLNFIEKADRENFLLED